MNSLFATYRSDQAEGQRVHGCDLQAVGLWQQTRAHALEWRALSEDHTFTPFDIALGFRV